MPVNPFTDETLDDRDVISNITDRTGLTNTTVAVRLSQSNSHDGSRIKFIEWDFLQNNATDAAYQKIKPLIQGLWQNGHPIVEGREVIDLALLQRKLAGASLPRTPKEKIDNLILFIANQQTEDGSSVTLFISNTYKRLYFKSPDEFSFYLEAIREDGLVNTNTLQHNVCYVSITYKGLSYVADLELEGPASRFCFVAMSFDTLDPEIYSIYQQGIKPALDATGFAALRVDEYHPDAEQTINDFIIAGIKRSRFCVADFTQHKKGVYFEAGYALGRGQKVIYTCRNDHFADSHFDTNHYPHILYDTPEELREKLVAKIGAWILE